MVIIFKLLATLFFVTCFLTLARIGLEGLGENISFKESFRRVSGDILPTCCVIFGIVGFIASGVTLFFFIGSLFTGGR